MYIPDIDDDNDNDNNDEDYNSNRAGSMSVDMMQKEGVLHCGALTSMSMSFARFVRDVNPKYVAVAFDASSRTFRNDLFDEYKITRIERPINFLLEFAAWPERT